MGDEIGAKVVIAGDTSGAQAAVKGLATETQALTATTDRAGDAGQRYAQGQQAAQTATAATSTGLQHLKGNALELIGALPGVGSTLSGAISGATSAFGQLSGVASAAANGPIAGVTAGLGVLTASFGLAEKAIDSFASKQVRIAALDAALADSGQLTEATRAKYQALAAELGKATGQGGALIGVLARLTEYGADDTNIRPYAEAVKNLAGLLGGDLDQAARIFGRAINGNTAILRRYGIEVDHTKSQHEQLADAMQQLAQRGGSQLGVQTQTLSGQVKALGGAVSGLFSGVGNLISQTGIVQLGLSAVTGTIRLLGSVLPKTVEQVDGLTNKLPPLRDEFGHVNGAADDLGEGIEEVGGSSDSAAGGLGRAAQAAGKVKDEYEQAEEAAKKLRQQQDALADAQTALKLAQVDADEAKKLAAPGADRQRIGEDANRQRAQIRVDGERAAFDRKDAEQQVIIDAQVNKRFAAKTHAYDKAGARDRAQADFSGGAGAAGLTPAEAAEIGTASETKGEDIFGQIAKDRRAGAQRATDTAGLLSQGEYVDQDAVNRAEKQAEVQTKEAEALESLAKKFFALRQATADATTANEQYQKTSAETQTTIDAAKQEQQVLAIQRRTAATKADTEQQKLTNDDREKEAARQEQLRQTELKRLEEELKRPGITDQRRQQVVDARRGIEAQSDAYADRDASAAQVAQNTALRRTQRTTRDAQDTGGGDAVVGDVRALAGALNGNNQPSREAQALIAQILKSGGKNSSLDQQLVQVLTALLDALGQGRDPKLEALVKKLQTDLATVQAQVRNAR